MGRITVDTETVGFHGIVVLLQWAEDDGEIHLHEVWKRPVRETLELIEYIADREVIGFNLVFDWFHICKVYTLWKLLPEDWIPEDHIDEIALKEQEAMDGPCLKPRKAMDLLLHSRNGPFQSLMSRDDIRITKIPIPLSYALAAELENLIERMVVLGSNDRMIDEKDLPYNLLFQEDSMIAEGDGDSGDGGLNQARHVFERQYILRALQKCRWNQTEAARTLKIHRNTLIKKMRDLNINRKRNRS